MRTRAPSALTFSVSVLSLGMPSSSGQISTVTALAVRFSKRAVGTGIVFPNFLRANVLLFHTALGGMSTDSSSPVSDGQVFARTWRDLHASAVPRIRGEPLAASDQQIPPARARRKSAPYLGISKLE